MPASRQPPLESQPRRRYVATLQFAQGPSMTAALRDAAGAYYCADVAALRERRRRQAAQARDSSSKTERDTHRAPSCQWLTPWINWRLGFAKSLICGAAGRIRTHDPLVRSNSGPPAHRASWSSASINSCRVVQSSAESYLPKSYPASRHSDHPDRQRKSFPRSQVGAGQRWTNNPRIMSHGTASALELL